jgi:hypothetical protein
MPGIKHFVVIAQYLRHVHVDVGKNPVMFFYAAVFMTYMYLLHNTYAMLTLVLEKPSCVLLLSSFTTHIYFVGKNPTFAFYCIKRESLLEHSSLSTRIMDISWQLRYQQLE